MLPGICIILLFYAFGECIALLTGRLIPGSVIGMILLFAALCGKVVKPETVRPVARFLTDNMGLFFLPAGVGIVNDMALLAYSLILAINRPIEMLVTSLNVVGDAVASICVAKSEGLLNEETFNK